MVKNKDIMSKHNATWYYEMQNLGYNYRITDIQCALGSNQLKKLDRFIKRRQDIAAIYNTELDGLEYLKTPKSKDLIKHAYHLYPVLIDFKKVGKSKNTFFEEMKNNGVNLQVHYIPVHFQPFYKKKYGFNKGDFEVAEQFYEKEVSLPIYPDLKIKDIQYVCNLIKKICN